MFKTTLTIVMAMLCLNFNSKAQNVRLRAIDIRGRVLDDQNKPLPGALVRVKSTIQITRTNNNGDYLLKGVPENSMIMISYLGYEPKEIIASANMGNIQLLLKSAKLDEVEINAGYYSVKQRELTGSISKITAKTIEQQTVSNPLQALQNRVAGLEITQLTGVPGGGFKVQIRGRNSISSGNSPLYIVDGVTYPSARINLGNSAILGDASPLSMMNPNDIESIEVLKDADATAIYGSRGANGVILITTKKGTIGETKVDASIHQGIGQVGHKLNLLNTQQYLAMRKEALLNGGLNPTAADLDLTAWDQDKYTDWQEELIGGTASIHNSSVKISGGSSNSNYLINGSYYSEGSVFPGSFGFKRGGSHVNINFGPPKSALSANFTASYFHAVSNLPSTEPTGNILRAPNAPDAYDEYGQLNWYHNGQAIGTNPIAVLLNTTDASTDNLVANTNLSYRILNNFFFKASIGYTSIKREELAKFPNTARNPAGNPTAANRQSQFGNTSSNSYIAEPQLTYNRQLGKGKIDGLLGMSFQQNISQYRNVTASNFSSDELLENISSAFVFSISENSYAKYKYIALFARVNYGLLDRYYLNLTARRDGSSRFGPGKQFANFGAVGAAWIFSEETAIKNTLPFLSFGKLRASYGITGNDQISDYQFMQLFGGNSSYQGSPSMYINRIANPDFAWETNKKAELALQLGFLQDRINVQVAYFRNRSSNQLLGSPLPPSVGAANITANLPAKVQNSGLELETSVQVFRRKNWNWTSSFNITLPKNKLIEYPDLATSGNATLYIIGQPLDVRRYYNTYVDPQTGLYAAEDKDGSGARNDADRYLHKFIGQVFYGGWQNSIQYKQFNLDFLVSFVKQMGNSLLSGAGLSPGFFLASSPLSNQPTAVLERWQNPYESTAIPKFSSTIASFTNFGIGAREGSQSLADNSFARLKNVSLSYRLPLQWLSKAKIKALEFSLQGQNLFTLTKFKGLDPENPGALTSKLPPLQTFSLGLKVTL